MPAGAGARAFTITEIPKIMMFSTLPRTIALAGAALLSVSSAFADTLSLRRGEDGVEIGAQVSRYSYVEPQVMENDGTKTGLTLTATTGLFTNYFVTGDVRYAFGDVEYSSNDQRAKDNDDKLRDVRLLGGRDVDMGSYLLAPYTGIGVRQLRNDLRGTVFAGPGETQDAGYRRESTYLYIPIGVTHRFHVDNESRISTTVEYDWFLSGTQTSRFGDVNNTPPVLAAIVDPGSCAVPTAVTSGGCTLSDVKNKQHQGYGVRFNIAYERAHWSVGFFYSMWSIKQSDTVTAGSAGVLPGVFAASSSTVFEPRNRTQEYGIEAKFRF
jgi:hypothetical protein